MPGAKSGVAARLKKQFSQIVEWHCFNYRLELSVGDAVKCCSEVNHFKCLMDTLYALYSQSPKCQRELAQCASELQVQLHRIGRVLDVRWVASSCRTVRAVWKSYAALHSHFVQKASDMSNDSKERSKFLGMAKKFESPVFLQNLGLMFDALEELSDLSLALQKADITLTTANKLVSKQIEIFSARKETGSEYLSEANRAVAAGSFKGVAISSNSGRQPLINRVQFYQCLVDSMTARMQPDAEKELSQATQALDHSLFTSELSPEFGESDVKFMCAKFGLSFSDLKFAYRNFKDSRGSVISNELLKSVINTIPVGTAACERGFSKMNIICSPLRTRLTLKDTSSLMFVSLSGPPVMLFEPLKYVKSWRDGHITGCQQSFSTFTLSYVFEVFSGCLRFSFLLCSTSKDGS